MFWKNWMANNIYRRKKGDGVAYFTLYIIIPIIITAVSLSVLASDNVSILYCYVTILISALNSIYDGANRWDNSEKSILNTKLFIVMAVDTLVAIYCAYVILYIMISDKANCRFDWILLVYAITFLISLVDTIGCFIPHLALFGYMKKEVIE